MSEAREDLKRLRKVSVNRKLPMANIIKELWKKYRGVEEKDLAKYEVSSFTLEELRNRFYNLMAVIEKAVKAETKVCEA